MATELQKRLAQAIIDNSFAPRPLNAGELLESVGYAVSTATTYPGAAMNRAGVLKELGRLGFTVDNAKNVVTQIMSDDDMDANVRLKAADMMFKVHGEYAPEKKDITTGGEKINTLTPEQIAKINAVALDE